MMALRRSTVPDVAKVFSTAALLILAAAALAFEPTLATMPKHIADGVILAEPIFDHSKVAMIDEFARQGLPAGNPFFGPPGDPSRLAYYYLWHFSAATAALVFGVNGWEADIALTWFTAFASLILMMGLAATLSGYKSAALWVILLSVSVSVLPVLTWLVGEPTLDRFLVPEQVLQSWAVQASWVPQHLASATCVLLVVLLLPCVAAGDRLAAFVLGAVAAASFESSVWIGGVTLAAAAGPLGLFTLWTARPGERIRIAILLLLAALLAAILAYPFLHDEASATASRAISKPIAFEALPILGPAIPEFIRHYLDLPAFWLIYLVLKLPAIYPAGLFMLWRLTMKTEASPIAGPPVGGFAILAVISCCVSWLLISTIANNDLGWRSILPGIMILTVFAAVGVSRWIQAPAPVAAFLSVALFALGLPDGFALLKSNLEGRESPVAAAFAASGAMWEHVRHYAGPDDRVANNPQYLREMTSWPVNISWALLSDRPSCFSGRETARAYVALPGVEIDRLENFFTRVFGGEASDEDIRALATRYNCAVAVVTAGDGAWDNDPFARSSVYRLAEEQAGQWRIYVAVRGSSAMVSDGVAARGDTEKRRDDAIPGP